MSEKLRVKVIGLFLGITVIWAGFNYVPNIKEITYDTPKTIQPLDPNNSTKTKSVNFIDKEEIAKAKWGQSPFYITPLPIINTERPHTVVHNNTNLSWILSGIILNSSSPTAIINKRPVKIGETINRAIVTNIEKEKVIIKYKQKEITLTISKG